MVDTRGGHKTHMRLSVNRDSLVPLQDQIVAQYSFLIAGGVYKHGELLPSIRSLAERLGVHRNTVAAAYRSLEDQGFVTVKAGSGIRVAMREGVAYSAEGVSEGLALKHMASSFVREALKSFSEAEIREAVDAALTPQDGGRIVVVLSSADSVKAVRFELDRIFAVDVDIKAIDDLRQDGPASIDDALLLTSQYNLQVLRELLGPERRIVVYRIEVEPLLAELRAYPPGTTLGVVSASATQLERAKAILSGLWDPDLLLAAHLDDRESIEALVRMSDALAMDFMSYERAKALSSKPMHVYRYFSESALRSLSLHLPAGAFRQR